MQEESKAVSQIRQNDPPDLTCCSLTVTTVPKYGLCVQDERQEVVGLAADRVSCMTRSELRPAGRSFFCPDADDSPILLSATVSPY